MRARQKAAISSTACDGPAHVHAFFSDLVRPVLKHGRKSLTVEQVFFVGAGTGKRLESACVDLGTGNRLVILRVVCARAQVFGVSLSFFFFPSLPSLCLSLSPSLSLPLRLHHHLHLISSLIIIILSLHVSIFH